MAPSGAGGARRPASWLSLLPPFPADPAEGAWALVPIAPSSWMGPGWRRGSRGGERRRRKVEGCKMPGSPQALSAEILSCLMRKQLLAHTTRLIGAWQEANREIQGGKLMSLRWTCPRCSSQISSVGTEAWLALLSSLLSSLPLSLFPCTLTPVKMQSGLSCRALG